MTDGQIESKVKAAFTSDIPDNFDEILSRCKAEQEKNVAKPQRKWKVIYTRRIISAAAVMVIVFAAGIVGHILTKENFKNSGDEFFSGDITNDDFFGDSAVEDDFFGGDVIVNPEDSSTDNASSNNDSSNTSSTIKNKKGIKKIVDKSHRYLKTGTITKFYEEDFYAYFCVSGKSDGIIVYFKDGTKMGVTEAFEKQKVTLADLDNFGVKYIKDFAGSEIFDLTETYDCGVKNKPQEFYKDKNFSYFFQSKKADYVKYRDYSGKTWRVADALKSGIIKPYDIGNSNIDFGKKYLGNELLIVNESEGYFTTQALMEFYRDDDFKYEFSSGISVVVYYPDGTKQGVTKALESGKIKVTDLDKFGIGYIKTLIK